MQSKRLIRTLDSTIGAGSIDAAAANIVTPTAGMVVKILYYMVEPIPRQPRPTAMIPQLAKWSPFHGALYAVVEAVSENGGAGRRLPKC